MSRREQTHRVWIGKLIDEQLAVRAGQQRAGHAGDESGRAIAQSLENVV